MNDKDNSPWQFSRNIWLTTGMLVVLVFAFAAYVWSEKQIDRANEKRQQSFMLAEELRQSSDDLTRMVRTYVATGNPVYKQHYQDILDIRNGKKPRPVDYGNIYWDLVTGNGKPPRPDSKQSIALLDLMHEAGFTDEEFSKLAEAKANSDGLTSTEYAAMRLVETPTFDRGANRTRAIVMLYDEKYHQAKASIMRPIAEFHSMLAERTLNEVKASKLLATILRIVVGVLGVGLVLLLWNSYKGLLTALGGTVDEVHQHIEQIGRGDFNAPITLAADLKNSIMGWLVETQKNLLGLNTKNQSITQSLKDSEEKLYAILNASEIAISWASEDGTIEYVNPKFVSLFGYTLEDVPTIEEWYLHAYPDISYRKKVVDEWNAKMANALSARTAIEPMEVSVTCKDGSVRHTILMASWAGTKLLANFSDITVRRLFETEINRLAQAVEQNPTGILITDNQGTLSYTNQAYTKITGYQFAETYAKTQRELISTELTDDEFKEIETCLRAGKPLTVIVQNRHKNGTLCWEQITAAPIYDDNGQIASYLFLRTDISERKQNEEELRRYRDHLEDEVQQRTADLILARNAAETANHAKSVFLANMSHELRTPLNAILGFSNMMRNNPHLQADQQQNLDVINRSGEHLLTLINDILDMAKIEAGRVQLESAPFDLGGMVRDVADMMDVRAREKGLRLLIDQSSQFPRYIVGDEARLRQVLINLVGNAIKFTDQGGVTVRLGTKNNAIAHLLLEVEDSGPGIAPQDQQRIFEPFEQLGSQGGVQGTGLGLTITRQFVQLMGGRIELESIQGKGSLFRIDLPLKQADKADVARLGNVEKGEVVGLAPGQPAYRILVVEDQLENRLLLARLMESVGFQVKCAENGQQGVELFQSWRPHLIWMDHRMPLMDGDEATRIIRSLPGGKDVKIVAVTASAFSEQRAELLKAGMDDFLRKPYRFNEIYECVSNHLGVQYTYRNATAPMDEPSALTPEMLSILPESLRQALIQALESLESDRIETLIQQVATYDANLQKTLVHFANNFDYPTILKALKSL